MSEQPDHPDFTDRVKHKIGDKVRVVKVTLTANDAEDTKHVFLQALGNIFEVKEVNLWQPATDNTAWHVTYEIEVGKHDIIFLNEDEVEKAE